MDRLRWRETVLTERVWDDVEAWTLALLANLHAQFYRYGFVNRWDLSTAKRYGADRQIIAATDQSLDELADRVTEVLEDEVIDGYQDGYSMTLWDGYRAGALDIDDLRRAPIPDDDRGEEWLLAAAIAGLTLKDRAKRWMGDAKLRVRNTLNVALARNLSLHESNLLFENLGESLTGRLSVLGQSELQRAFFGGQTASILALLGRAGASKLLGELWWSRMDGRVCPVCASLHGTLTVLTPIADTHPGCRCVRVPMWELVNAEAPLPSISYEDFLLFLDELS